ncbi:hypothetical protein L208DRAFT_825505 [Tricholoma matsutake]|nr:hypothetical protein L208DRAFT_825505 [Tricholoma matsutake 945]
MPPLSPGQQLVISMPLWLHARHPPFLHHLLTAIVTHPSSPQRTPMTCGLISLTGTYTITTLITTPLAAPSLIVLPILLMAYLRALLKLPHISLVLLIIALFSSPSHCILLTPP